MSQFSSPLLSFILSFNVAWSQERDCQEKWLQEKAASLRAQQEQLRAEQQDVEQQRELLYRKLEVLKSQGIILSPTLTVMNTALNTTSHLQHDDTTPGLAIQSTQD